MKRYPLLLLFLSLMMGLTAYPALITSWNLEADVKTMNDLGLSVDYVNRSTGTIRVWLRSDAEYKLLLDSGFNAIKLPDDSPAKAAIIHSKAPGDGPQNDYYSVDQYNQFMIQTAADYPSICQLHTIGTSVQGRPISFLKISDNVAVNEPEPEFKYISSIHGNEVVGFDLMIRLIQQLTSEYGTVQRITELVNNTEIWICPLMNPDGYVLGQRYNANGVDLNRNFPMPTGNQHPDGNAWQPENIAVMDFGNAHNFILSANFHGGALVMNYPWDYTYVLAPDDALLQAAALTYSIHNDPMYNSNEFENGITNGAAWYVITGSMQDWNYGLTDCMDITAEIGNNMWPPYSQIPTYWAQNQESMLSYMEFVHRGVHGLVTNGDGVALDATITVSGNAKVMHTDPSVGDFHRMLLPGDYTITAEAAGYIPQTAQVTVPASGSTSHDFVLLTAQSIDFVGQLRTADGNPLAGVAVYLNTDPPSASMTDVNGCFTFTGLLEGNYTLSVNLSADETYETDFTHSAEEHRQVFIVLPRNTLFGDSFDSMTNWTATSPWGLTTDNGNSVLTDSPSGNYSNNSNRSCRLTNPVTIQNLVDPQLRFRTRYDLENNYDYVHLEISTDNANWTNITSYTGTQSAWQQQSFTLDGYEGQSVYFRFRLRSDYNVSADGIYIDDFMICGGQVPDAVYGDADGNFRVNKRDVTIILKYAVGLDPIPEIDPLPWDDQRIENCDVDLDQLVRETDAYLVYRYLRDPLFRFEAQTGSPTEFANVALSHDGTGQMHIFEANPENELKCYNFQFIPVSEVAILDFGVTPLSSLYAFNPAQNRIAWACGDDPYDGFVIWLQSTQSPVTCAYRLNGVEGNLVFETVVPNSDELIAPVFSLAQNHPNPFNPSTDISYSIADPTLESSLTIFNSRGQLVRTLVHGIVPKGSHSVVWDGKDALGKEVSSGIYLYRLINGKRQQTRKMILMK